MLFSDRKNLLALYSAVKRAVDECISEGSLREFLSKNRAEVINMSIFEYDKELEEKKLRKAEYDAGFSSASIETAKRMLNLHEFSLEKIAAISGLTIEEVRQLQSGK